MEYLFYNTQKNILYSAIFLVIFFVSLLGFLYPTVNILIFCLIVVVCLILTSIKLEYGVYILFLDLFIGNKGYLFSFSLLDYVVSLRMVLFFIVISIYLFKLFKDRNILFIKTNAWKYYVVLMLFLFIGVINGLINNPLKIIFYDFNAYFYLALIFPIYHVISQSENFYKLIKLLTVSSIALSVLTVIIFLDFGLFHYSPALVDATKIESKQLEELDNLSTIPENARLAQTTKIAQEKLKINWSDLSGDKPVIYRWLKDTGFAEVSFIGGRFFRVFMPSQFYLYLFFIFLSTSFFNQEIFDKKKFFVYGALSVLSTIAIIISFSRSFWLGLIGSFLFLIISMSKKRAIKTVIAVFLVLIIFSSLIYFIDQDTFTLISNRLTSLFKPNQELAASNRINLLSPLFQQIKEKPWLGSGFGTLITYKALIPGTEFVEYIKVYLYEWAYLDIIIKIGIFGFLSYFLFIFSGIKNAIINYRASNRQEKIIFKSLFGGLIFLMIVHTTTPYLNHPLGIGYIMLFIVYMFKTSKTRLYDYQKSIN